MQRFVDKIVFKRKKRSIKVASQLLASNQGMTLIEIMVASGISVVVSMGIAGIYIFAIQQFTILVNMNTAQENLLWMAYHTKNTMSQAVNVAPLTGCTPNPSSIVGCIPSSPVTGRLTSVSGNTIPVAIFQREWSTNGISEILPTAIFFREPTATREGRITFDINTPEGQPLIAGADDIWYDQVVKYDIKLTLGSIYGISQATGVKVMMATRYHRSSSDNKRWCVPGDTAAGCIDGVSSSDVSMTFNVGLRNNFALDKTPSGQLRSIHGGIYYYRFIPPIFRDVQ